MKKILFLSFLFITFYSNAQWNPTGSKTRFVPGIGLGTRDTTLYSNVGSHFADSNIVVMHLDSALYYKGKGWFKPIGSGGGGGATLTLGNGLLGTSYNGSSAVTAKVDTATISTKANVTALLTGYASGASVVKYTDTASMLSSYYNKTATDSRLALKLNISDTAAMLSTHPNTTLVNSQLALKLDKSDSTIANRVTADRVFTNAALALKVNYTDTATMLGNYYNKTATDSRLALKLNISDTAAMLSTHPNLTYVTSNLATKQNTLTLTTTGTSGAATLVGATLNIPQYAGGGGGGTVTSVAINNASGLTGTTPITSTGTIGADTSILSTKANVTASLIGYAANALVVKYTDTASMLSTHPNLTYVTSNLATKLNVSDSVLANRITADRVFVNASLPLKLNISDTAAMLGNYYNKTATDSRLALKVNYTDTSAMLGNYLRTANYGTTKTGQALGVDTSLISTKANVTASLLSKVGTIGVTTANGVSGTSSGGVSPSLTISLGAITPTSVNSVVLSGSTTPTLAVTGTSSISGSNTGDNAVNTLYSGLATSKVNVSDTATMLGNYLRTANWGTIKTAQALGVDSTLLSTKANVTAKLIGYAADALVVKYTDTTSMLSTHPNKTYVDANVATKQNTLTLTTTGTSGAATLVGATLNIPNYATGGGGTTTNALTLGNGLNTGSFNGSAAVTATVDTLLMTTKNWHKKGIDSLANVASVANALKVNISDTAAMLSTHPNLTYVTSNLATKQNTVSLTTTGTSGAATFNSSTGALNIPNYAGTVTSVAASVPSFLSVTGSPITSSGTLAISYSGTALPIANGGTNLTALPTSVAASTFAAWDANGNLSADNFIPAFTSTATAGGTTVLTVGSSQQQYFTGTLTQTVTLPVVTTLVNGFTFYIFNKSTGSVTVQTSGAVSLVVLPTNTMTEVTVVDNTAGTGTASWIYDYAAINTTGGSSGTVTSVSVTTANGISGTVATATTTPAITLSLGAITPTTVNGNTFTTGSSTYTGTAAATYTFPTSTKTIAANDGSNWTIASQAIGDILVASSTTAYGRLADAATGNALISGGAGVAPSYGKIGLTTHVSGTLPIANGGTNATAVTTAAAATAWAGWDANKNMSANNFIPAYTTTATAAGTTTLTVASTHQQFFTGTTTQTVTLPVATTLVNGFKFKITNNSTGVVTVQTSGAVSVVAMAANTTLDLTCINTAGGTGTASWGWAYQSQNNTTIAGSGTTTNALTMNNGGAGAVSGTTFNGSAAQTISYNTIGASPLAGSASLTTTGTITSGTWNGTLIDVAHGGTGLATLTANTIYKGNGTTALAASGLSDNGTTISTSEAFSGGNITSSGQFSTTGSGAIFTASGATTSAKIFNITNTSGGIAFGVESSTGGSIVAGSTAYATVFTSTGNIQTYIGSTKILDIGSSSIVSSQNMALGGTALSGSGSSRWLTTDGTSVVGGGLISSVSGVAKAYYFYDGTYAAVQGSTSIGVALQYNGGTNGLTINGTSGNATFGATVTLAAYTVATLPTAAVGMICYVTDASAPTYGATVAGGGAVKTLVFYDGTNWKCH